MKITLEALGVLLKDAAQAAYELHRAGNCEHSDTGSTDAWCEPTPENDNPERCGWWDCNVGWKPCAESYKSCPLHKNEVDDED